MLRKSRSVCLSNQHDQGNGQGSAMKKIHAIVFGVILVFFADASGARELVINQENNKFSEVFLKIGSKDKIKIVNLDSVNHKISFLYRDQEQLVAELEPGATQVIELNSPGLYDIKSYAHPEMKMTAYVPPVIKIGVDRTEYYF